MSELREKRWSVLSERGCEAAGLDYEEAAQLVRRLRADRVHGLCIISDEAARRVTSNNYPARSEAQSAIATTAVTPPVPARKRPVRRRKNAELPENS